MHKFKRLSALVLILILSTQIFTGCSSRKEAEETSPGSSSSSSGPKTTKPAETGKTVASITPDFKARIEDMHEDNEDTIGWLQVPGTSIEDVVLFKPTDITNEYYLRKDINQYYSFNGVYYVDYRASFGDGSRKQIGPNICIYGHAISDNEEDDRYSIKFGPLHDFRNPEFAKDTPYIFFSTAEENLAYEIIAVFVANADNSITLPYNNGGISQEDYVKMVREEVLPRSKYNYDVEIKDDDKFLCLSTCIYTLDNGTSTGYPNTYYRYVVMGRLTSPDEPLKEEAVFTENPDPVIDPDGKWSA